MPLWAVIIVAISLAMEAVKATAKSSAFIPARGLVGGLVPGDARTGAVGPPLGIPLRQAIISLPITVGVAHPVVLTALAAARTVVAQAAVEHVRVDVVATAVGHVKQAVQKPVRRHAKVAVRVPVRVDARGLAAQDARTHAIAVARVLAKQDVPVRAKVAVKQSAIILAREIALIHAQALVME